MSWNIDQFTGTVGYEFFDLVVLDVDVFHSAMQDRVLRAFDAADVIFVEHGRNFSVEEGLRHLGRFEVFWDEETIDAGGSEVGVFAEQPSEPDVLAASIGCGLELGFCRG